MGADTAFTEMWQRRPPLKEFLEYPKVQAIAGNPELLRTIWKTVQPDLTDLPKYLDTGRSPKYSSEPILGRWSFDVNAALGNYLRANPNIASSEMQKIKRWLIMGFSKTSLTARTDHQVTMKNAPQLTAPLAGGIPAPGNQPLQGTWKSADGKYQITLAGAAELNATVNDDKMLISGAGNTFIFNRED